MDAYVVELNLNKKFSSMISSHFNTAKHKKKCLNPTNQLYKEDFGISNNLTDAFDNKCKELRELKKINYEYKAEMDKLKHKSELLENLNKKLQKKLNELSIIKRKSNIPITENLIDL